MDENALGVAHHFPLELRGEYYVPGYYAECSCGALIRAADQETVWELYIDHLRAVGDGLVGRADHYDDAVAALQEHVHPGPLSTTIGSLIRMKLLVGSEAGA